MSPPTRRALLVVLVALLIVAATALSVARRDRRQPSEELGGTMGCRRPPRFVADLDFPERSAFSTSEDAVGLVLVDLDAPDHFYQDPTWARHGALGPFTYDAVGNLYVAPTPRTGMFGNPPEELGTIFKVDTNTGTLAPYVRLDDPSAGSDPAGDPTGDAAVHNPFGILELTYDCGTDSLYAASVVGSTRLEENGQIVRIDLGRDAVADRLAGVDAIGLGAFVGPRGKRLYYGSARRPEVWSIGLGDQGDFAGTPRLELKLPLLQHRAGEMRFDSAAHMTLVSAPFDFTLVPRGPEDGVLSSFVYVPQTDAWVLDEP